MTLEIDAAALRGHFEAFARIGNLGPSPEDGFTRLAFSDEESAAHAYVRRQAEAAGLTVRVDAVGNTYCRTPGDHAEVVQTGSHLDSVPQGGNYDGAAGVLCGLEAVKAVVAAGTPLARGLEVVAWRGEEHTYDAVYKGSAAAFGVSEPAILDHEEAGRALREAIEAQGLDPGPIASGTPTLSAAERDAIAAHVELHIEQAVRLEEEGKDIGVVTSINGDRRLLALVEGRFDHSGATPMGARYRRDANLAIAEAQVALDALARGHLERGVDFVQTVGVVNADPGLDRKHPRVHANSATKVSGFGYFTLDVMAPDDAFLTRYAEEARAAIRTAVEARGCAVAFEVLDVSAASGPLDARIQDRVEAACREVGCTWMRMPSGAGHDAALVAKQPRSDGGRIPVGLIFVPCRGGVSHAKEEHASPEALATGARVLAGTLAALARA